MTRALLFLTVVVMTQFFWTRTLHLPQAFNWTDDVAAVALGILALMHAPPRIRLSHLWAWALLLVVLSAVVSTLTNAVPWWRALLGMRGILLYVCVYYSVVVARIRRHDMLRVLRVLFWILLLQLPLQLIEFSVGVLKSGADWKALADIAVGSLGTGMANALGFLTLPFIAGAVAFWIERREARWMFVAASLVVSLVLSSGRAALALLPLVLLTTMVLSLGWRRVVSPRTVAATVIVALAVVGAADAYYQSTSGESVFERFSPSALIAEQLTYNPMGSSRLLYYPVTWNVLQEDAASPWLGLGPGNYASGAGYLTNAPGLNAIRDVFGQWETNRETALNSQLLTSLGELGILGVSAFLAMIIALALRTLHVRRAERDPTLRIILTMIFVGQILFAISTPAEAVWEDQVLAFPFWLCSAFVVKVHEWQHQNSSLADGSTALS